jgi:hypothetical protein
VHNKGCKLIDMDPFEKSVKEYWKKAKKPKCDTALVKSVNGVSELTLNYYTRPPVLV